MRWDLRRLLLDHPCQIAFGVLRTQHRSGCGLQRCLSRRIHLEMCHALSGCKSGTISATYSDVNDDVQPAAAGYGPLLQRDYWAVLDGCEWRPSELIAHVKSHFCELPPASLVQFEAPDGVRVDAHLHIRIAPGQSCRVRVVHEDAQSLTLATLEGHPEAGRITFGAYRHSTGAVVFHIRSRARSASASTRLGFLAIGDAMQTNTWTDVINRIAADVGATIADVIHAETETVEEQPGDRHDCATPTFLAVGD